jgi:hypothetical protein
MRKGRLAQTLIVLLAASLACQLPSRAGPVATPILSSQTPSSDAASDVLPTPQGGITLIEQEPPPASMVEILQAKVDSGEWTQEQGLIAGLQVLAGETSMKDAFGESPWTGEGTGILNLSFYDLAHGTDDAASAEIERLLAIVAPSPTRLLEYAEPEGSQSRRSAGLSAPIGWTLEECQKFFEEGFPGFPAGQNILCLLYKEQTLGGYKARVFYPSWWTPNDPQWPYLQAAHEAVAASWNLYSTFGEMRAIDLVFTVLGDKSEPETAAVAPGLGGAQSCQIAIYPNALAASAGSDQKSGVSLGEFRQIVAHEMFHCFQSVNFGAYAWDQVNWEINDWWGESTADYFSNLVYPTVNLEWQTAPEFALKSTNLPIFGMSYANSVFFQYLGNKLGNQAILDLIGSLPPNSLEAQWQTLSSYSGMDVLWHDFGELYVQGRIPDTSGPFLPNPWPQGLGVKITAPEAKVEVGALPFTLARRLLVFKNTEPLKKGWLYQNSVGEAGPPGIHSAQLPVPGSPWGPLPPSLSSGCADVLYVFLATTTAPDADVYEATIEVKATEETACDDCLIGVWDINIESYTEYSEAPFAGMPGFYTLDAAGGLWRYRFNANGTMTGEFNFLHNYHLNQANAPFGNDITVTGLFSIEGTAQGAYVTDGLSNLTVALSNNGVKLAQDLYMNGELVQQGPIDTGLSSSGASYLASNAIYSCDDDAGELLINFLPELNLPPIQFDRVSKQP